MKTKLFFFLGASALFFSCGSSNSDNTETTATETKETAVVEEIAAIDTVSANYMLLKNQCLICHGGNLPHDAIIAPPMQGIKNLYQRKFTTKEEFVNAVVAWGLNPTEEAAVMKGAVKRFNLMPKPATSEEDLRVIAEFVYDNELQEPAWFAEQFNKMHGEGSKGMKMGKSK